MGNDLSINSQVCLCGGGEFERCCMPIIDGSEQATTAERLMMARYSAYATGAIDFLEQSTHSKRQCSMKRACQGKTSPLLALKSYFFDRQPLTYP